MQSQLIRCSIRTLQDMQKIRIQNGNRLVASFRNKIGLDTNTINTKNDDGLVIEEDHEAENFLNELRNEYKRITDGIVKVTRKIKIDSPLISNYGELILISAYEKQLEAEIDIEKTIKEELKNIPLWNEWLLNVRGIGPIIAGTIISEIDIHKSNSISALYKYCGIDVVVFEDEHGNIVEEGRSKKKHHLVPKSYTNRAGEVINTVGITYNPLIKTKLLGVLGPVFIKLGGEYRDVYDDYKHRLEHHPKHCTKYVIYRNDILHSDEEFESEKDANICIKILNKVKIDDAVFTVKMLGKSKKHRHNMAVRYMIKEFLADLWTVWRSLEGLPIRGTYAEEKLGIIHSKPKRIQTWLDAKGIVYPVSNYVKPITLKD